MGLSVVTHRRMSTVGPLAGEWQELHDSSGDVNPFSGPDWALTWLEHFSGGNVEPYVLEVRQDSRLVGVAPLARKSPLRGRLRTLQPVGHGLPWIGPYEVPTPCLLPGVGR